MNARFQIAIHILTLLDYEQGTLVSSDYIAGSLNTNPALVRKEISNLRNHGLIESKEGKGGGYTLGKPATQITLADVFKTLNVESVLGTSKNKPNPDCPIGRQIDREIGKLYNGIDATVLASLSNVTLAQFTQQFK
jgi:Rrf2 family protein